MTRFCTVFYSFVFLTGSLALECGRNEMEVDCPEDCEYDYCPKSKEPLKSCSKPNPCPAKACKCIFNYRKAANGSCIAVEDCPPFKCDDPNETYTSCPPYCPSDDCADATVHGECPYPGLLLIVNYCTPSCRCKKGYWRSNGKCVPYENCPNIKTRTQVASGLPSPFILY